MGKQVKVVTACGEEHVYKYNQEVKSAEIVEAEVPKEIDTTLKQIASALNKFVDRHHKWYVTAYAEGYHTKDKHYKTLVITIREHVLDEIMQLIAEDI